MTDDTETRPGLWRHILDHSGSPADRRNQYRFLAATFVWAIAFVAATRLLRDGLDGTGAWVIAVIPGVLGVIAMWIYLKFLKEADEMIRRIQINGVAIGFAIGILVAVGYHPFQLAGAPAIDTMDMFAVMMFAWVAGQIIALRRYR